MTSDDKIREYFKEQNILHQYISPVHALESLLDDHEVFMKRDSVDSTSFNQDVLRTYDTAYNLAINTHHISINELRNMTIKEIVDFLSWMNMNWT